MGISSASSEQRARCLDDILDALLFSARIHRVVFLVGWIADLQYCSNTTSGTAFVIQLSSLGGPWM